MSRESLLQLTSTTQRTSHPQHSQERNEVWLAESILWLHVAGSNPVLTAKKTKVMMETMNQILNQLLPYFGISFVVLFVYMIIKPFHDYYKK